MKKALIFLLGLVFAFAAVGCDNDEPSGETTLSGLVEDTTYAKYAGVEYSLGEGGLTLTNPSKGGWTLRWDDAAFDLNGFNMTFRVKAEQTENYQHWIGFAFTAESEYWYDTSDAVLVFFRPQYDAGGKLTGKASFNTVTVLKGFSSLEKDDNAVVCDLNCDGTSDNTFEAERSETAGWVMKINGTPIVVKQGAVDSTEKFDNVYDNMTGGKCYIQFASQREATDGVTEFTVKSIGAHTVDFYF